MSAPELPPEGAVLVVADDNPRWGAVVADRNAAGQRTALLVVTDPEVDPAPLAESMATEVFAGAPWTLVDTREEPKADEPTARN